VPLRIDLINAALRRIGGSQLQSESSPNGSDYVQIYDAVIGSLCSEYPWTFQLGFQQLAQLTKPTLNRWAFGYALPSDLAGTPRAVFDTITQNIAGIYSLGVSYWAAQPAEVPVTDFEIYGGVLYANYTQLWMLFSRLPNPNLWPPYFTELATKLLMAEYSIPVREDAPMRAELLREIYGPIEHQGEGGLIAKSKAIDAQGKPSSKMQIGSNPLTAVRFT
jgi:hypothetical protein